MDLDPAVQLIHTSTALPLASTSTIRQYYADRLLEALGRTRLQYIRPLLDVLLQAPGNFEHKLGRTFDPQVAPGRYRTPVPTTRPVVTLI